MSKIGSMLRNVGLIDDVQLQKALEEQKRTHETIGTILVKLGFVSETDLTNTLGKQLGVASVDLSHYEIDNSVLKIISVEIAKKYKVIPLHRMGYTITLAMANPTNVMAIDDIKFRTGFNIEPVVAAETSIMKSIEKYYGADSGQLDDLSDSFDEDIDLAEFEVIEDDDEVSEAELMSQVEDEPVVKLVQNLIAKAVVDKVSDIHIEPYEKTVRVRFRLDGTLQTVLEPPKKLQNAITSRIKILSKLDIAERRLPQDGRCKFKVSKRKVVDLRVSTLPTVFGEKVVMRILDKENLRLDLTKLGFEVDDQDKFKKAIEAPYGMVLVTGPTGSGKTTTLYSALSSLNKVDVNIMTAEDPVEFNLGGINQVNVHSEIGLSFASALRSFLRQAPDIVLVGEIRDFEPAEIAIKAALTGHLVLSTLHTNDAASTINRMINMGVEPFLIASSVVLILAQRLMKKLCPNCKEQYRPSDSELANLGISREEAAALTFYRQKGCHECNNTGYKGRVAIYEVMPVSENVRKVILERGSVLDIKEMARREGLRTLRESAVLKFKDGITSFEEIIRTTFED